MLYDQDLIDSALGDDGGGGAGGTDDGSGGSGGSGGKPSTGGGNSGGSGSGGTGGRGDGTGGREDGTGGSEDGTGGSEDGTGGSEDGTGGSEDGTGGSEDGTGGSEDGTGGSEDGTGGSEDGNGGSGNGGSGSGGSGSGGSGNGGSGSGGSGSGGSGSGGGGPVVYCEGLCIDNMNHLASTATWENPLGSPTGLKWEHADDTSVGGVWTAPASLTSPFMTTRNDHPEEGDAGYALRIANTGFSDWGFDVFVVLKTGGAAVYYDLSGYTGLRFWAKSEPGSHKTLSVALEDEDSNVLGDYVHPKLVSADTLTESWKLFEHKFSYFQLADSTPVDESAIYAIHFTMDPGVTPVDIMIDDLSFY